MASEAPKGRVIERLSLYSDECHLLLKQALERLPEDEEEKLKQFYLPGGRFADSSDDESSRSNHSYASDSESQSESDTELSNSHHQNETVAKAKPKPQTPPPTKKIDPRQHDANIRKHLETLSCHAFSVPREDQPSKKVQLHLASSLLSKEDRWKSPRALAQAYLTLSHRLGHEEKPVVVLCVRSGRFAGAVFRQGRCTHHRTCVRYTVRKGQGKAQSAQDQQRRPKSVGAQLRRAGEEMLQGDMDKTLSEWSDLVQTAALILISCPKTMKKSLDDSLESSASIPRDDSRIRRVPLDVGRPTHENAVLIHDVLTAVTLREVVTRDAGEAEPAAAPLETITEAIQAEDKGVSEPQPVAEESVVHAPLSALHVAAKDGDLAAVHRLLEEALNSEEEGAAEHAAAGEDFMTPLHYAAASTLHGVEPAVAAQVVTELLIVGKADPVRVDARNRPAYFLAAHEKVRDAFRVARCTLGEDVWDWDAAKVGPPLSPDDLQQRKEREAEKKKKKKARQKEKKGLERAQQQEMEAQQMAQAQAAEREQEAKRIRDGLEAKRENANNVCDFCQKHVKGRQRSQMYKRLEYAYCSTDCVQKHKRELMAAAAMQRFES